MQAEKRGSDEATRRGEEWINALQARCERLERELDSAARSKRVEELSAVYSRASGAARAW